MSRSCQSFIAFGCIAAFLMAAGCSSQPTIVPSYGPRPATDPGAVKLLDEPPAKYQILGVVETSENLKWGKAAQIDPVLDTLKTKAAELGANALLLDAKGSAVKATGMYRSKSYEVPIDKVPATKAMATAIWVIDE